MHWCLHAVGGTVWFSRAPCTVCSYALRTWQGVAVQQSSGQKRLLVAGLKLVHNSSSLTSSEQQGLRTELLLVTN
jgi:hypothetical protein